MATFSIFLRLPAIVFLEEVQFTAALFAVWSISEGLHQEIDPSHEIRVTIVSPGAAETELTDAFTDEDVLKALKEGGPMKVLEAQDIANTIAYSAEQPAHVDVNEILIRPTQQT